VNTQLLLDNLRAIQDFPVPGVNFRDVSTLFKNPACLSEMSDALYEIYKDKGITKVVGIESRGFVMASILAHRLGAGMVLARKPGKLPAKTIAEEFEKEYGKDVIEIHADAISSDDVVLLHDDLLATGGAMLAAYHLAQRFHPQRTYINFLIEITDEGLHGREAFPDGVEVTSLLKI